MDERRKDLPRYPSDHVRAATVNENMAAPASLTDPATLRETFAALNRLADEFITYRDRVPELDGRLAAQGLELRGTRAERDEALAKVQAYNVDRHSEQKRADHLQREVDWHKDARRNNLEDLGRVARERDHARAAVETLGADVDRLARERDEALAKVGPYAEAVSAHLDRARKSRDEALNRAEVLERERDAARAERDERFTSVQVGNLQASEAELVASPLRTSLAVARNRIATLEAGLAKEMAANASLANQAADELAARRECERQVHAAYARVGELEGWLACRERRQNAAEREVADLRLILDRLRPALLKIADTVAAEAVGQAIDPENPDYDTEPSRATLRDLARQVRHEVLRAQGRPGGMPDGGAPVSSWDGPTCGPQCFHEGSPGSPTE